MIDIPSGYEKDDYEAVNEEEIKNFSTDNKQKRSLTSIARRQKIFVALIKWVIVLCIVSGAFAFVFLGTDNTEITNYLIKVYVKAFLVFNFFAVLTLILLRNSIITNSAMLIMFRDSLNKNGKELHSLERELNVKGNTERILAQQMKDLNTTFRELNRLIQDSDAKKTSR